MANKAKGKYLKFLFQDDLLEPYCIESLFHIKKYEDVSFAFSDRDISLKIDQIKNARTFLMVVAIWQKKWTNIQEFQPGCELLEDPNFSEGPLTKLANPRTHLF